MFILVDLRTMIQDLLSDSVNFLLIRINSPYSEVKVRSGFLNASKTINSTQIQI